MGTTLSDAVHGANDKIKYDQCCKRILSDKYILAYILAGCVKEYQGCSINDIALKYIEGTPEVSSVPVHPDALAASRVRGRNNEDSSISEGTVFFDIRFDAITPEALSSVLMYINVEAQNDFWPGYPIVKRGSYYGCRMVSSQYSTEFTDAEYDKLKKVYSIWVCTSPPKKYENSITVYHTIEENVTGNVHEPEENYDIVRVVMVCLGKPENAPNDLLKLLDVLLVSGYTADEKCKTLETDFGIPMTAKLEKEVSDMGNFIDFVEARGIEKGMKKGMEKGMKKGMKKGMEKTVIQSLRSLMNTMKWTVQQAMDALEIPDDERSRYVKLLEQGDV